MIVHYHHCPECYEKHICDMECTIEPDLEDPVSHPGKQFGGHCVCLGCLNNQFDHEWFAKYNGFT